MCAPPNGLYVKDGTDYLLQPHTYWWDTVLCKYRLLSDLYSLTDTEISALQADPRYNTMFVNGGSGNTTQYNVDVNNGSNKTNTPTSTATTSVFDDMQSLLTPSQPQSKGTNILIILLIVAAFGATAYFLYKKLKTT